MAGPEGRTLRQAREINERGQVLATVGNPGPEEPVTGIAVWHRGTAALVATAPPPPAPTGAGLEATDLSERGEVVGHELQMVTPPVCCSQAAPFSWIDGEKTALPVELPAGAANAVNDRGQVLGWRATRIPDDPYQRLETDTVVWHDGQVTVAPPGIMDRASDINNRGQVAGELDAGTPEPVAAIWQVGGGITELGTLGGDGSMATAIDDNGQVVGSADTADGRPHAFLWRDGKMTDLGTLGGGFSVVGGLLGYATDDDHAVNDRGDVVGTSYTADGAEHAFLWRDGEMIDLGTLGGENSNAVAVNNRGQVVGFSETATGGLRNAFLWENGRMTDIGALTGEPLSVPTDINDRGQITGFTQGTEIRAVLWTIRPRRS